MTADLFAPWPEPPILADLRAERDDLATRLAAIATEARNATTRNSRTAGLVSARVLLEIVEGEMP